MRKWLSKGSVVIILIVTAVFRFTGIDWDGYLHYHPDERFITWVATSIEWPADWSSALAPHTSTFNPFHWSPDAESAGIVVLQDEDRDFAYGHLPLYLGVAATRLLERLGPALVPLLPADWLLTWDILNGAEQIEFRHLTAVSRALTALFDVGTVLIIFLLGRHIYGTRTGLLAAAFLAVNVMHIQLAHFFTFDPYMTFFVVTAVTLMAFSMSYRHRQALFLMLAAAAVGLAIGSKFAAVLLFLPLAFTVWLLPEQRWRWGITAVFIALLTFVITNPFAVLDMTCELISPAAQLGPISIPPLDWRSCFLENMVTQGAMVRGDIDLPFTRQYIGTTPFLYFIEMQLKLGMGPLLGIAAFIGFCWVIWQTWSDTKDKISNTDKAENFQQQITNFRLHLSPHPSSLIPHPSSLSHHHLLLLAWCLPYFLSTGSFHVKFMRYMQPLTPFLMLFAAAFIMRLPGRWRWGVGTAVLLTTTLYATAFVNLYRQPHPWETASKWVFANVPPDALILSEQWDDPLPTSMLVDGAWRRSREYAHAELSWLTRADGRDTEEALMENLALLAEADYLAIMSHRVYGVVPRLPQKFPLSSQYHPLLFDGSLGYEPVFVADRTPHLFGVHLRSDTFEQAGVVPPALVAAYLDERRQLVLGDADESFLVYDQPLVMIFENRRGLTAVQMRGQFAP